MDKYITKTESSKHKFSARLNIKQIHYYISNFTLEN
jgi:hypothetical protein